MFSRMVLLFVLIGSFFVDAGEMTEYSGVIRIDGDNAFLETDDGGVFRIQGTDIHSLREYLGMRVAIRGTLTQPQEENAVATIYASRISAQSCGDSALWECLYKPERIKVPPF